MPCSGQEIQWASELISETNNYSDREWSGLQVIGEPDALPLGALNDKAFRLNTNQSSGSVTVGYDLPLQVDGILIVESHNPGRITDVTLIDTEGTRHNVYRNAAKALSESWRNLHIKMPLTSYRVRALEVQLDASEQSGWPQIDAIGLEGFDPEAPQTELNPAAGILYLAHSPGSTQFSESEISGPEEIHFFHRKEKLSKKINSTYRECKPVISPDGKRLFFARRHSPENTGGKKDPQDIYYADFLEGEWQDAVNAGRPLNDRYPNGVCSVSPDGNTLLLINAYGANGIPDADGVSISQKTRNGWTKPMRQIIQGFENYCDYQDYALSGSGDVLILALQMGDSYGDQDLYVSFKTGDNTWSQPVNLGETVNTGKAEFAPFISSDETTLYFSSTGHGGFGESDVFYTRRLDESWLNWSEPVNMGEMVNSQYWDAYFTISADGEYAYLVSADGPRSAATSKVFSDENIYRISLNENRHAEPLILVQGKVLNSETKKPVEASIHFENLETNQEVGRTVSNPESGKYQINLPAGRVYGFYAQAEGFPVMQETLDLSEVFDNFEVTRDFSLMPIKVGQVLALNNLFFVQSKAEILPESMQELERLYRIMMEVPNLEIELGGHTDNQGLYSANLRLSRDRAEAVMQYLVDRGIDKQRIVVVGYGPAKPVASNANPESRQNNRRVEVKILKN